MGVRGCARVGRSVWPSAVYAGPGLEPRESEGLPGAGDKTAEGSVTALLFQSVRLYIVTYRGIYLANPKMIPYADANRQVRRLRKKARGELNLEGEKGDTLHAAGLQQIDRHPFVNEVIRISIFLVDFMSFIPFSFPFFSHLGLWGLCNFGTLSRFFLSQLFRVIPSRGKPSVPPTDTKILLKNELRTAIAFAKKESDRFSLLLLGDSRIVRYASFHNQSINCADHLSGHRPTRRLTEGLRLTQGHTYLFTYPHSSLLIEESSFPFNL